MCGCPQSLAKGIGSLGVGVPGSSELSDEGLEDPFPAQEAHACFAFSAKPSLQACAQVYVVLGIESRAACILGKYCIKRATYPVCGFLILEKKLKGAQIQLAQYPLLD